ncbi:MAG: type II toxin-antitoxin system RelE/ParE family toxin [Candidatus Woesearchaeota archaeon]|nr:MAG: type II toxin-antitoxin system RelE/ParE family toxin [Candidatus Woesearchaeota archaeon]
MTYDFEISEKLDKTLMKISKKDRSLIKAIKKKIDEICLHPKHYKPLRKPMQNLRSVHIGHFVLVYEINEKRKVVRFLAFKHHDKAYL